MPLGPCRLFLVAFLYCYACRFFMSRKRHRRLVNRWANKCCWIIERLPWELRGLRCRLIKALRWTRKTQ